MYKALIVATLLAGALSPQVSLAQKQKKKKAAPAAPKVALPKPVNFTLTNSAAFDRPDEGAVITRAQFKDLVVTEPNGDEIAFAIYDAAGKAVPFQLDDLDDEPGWDELALMTNFKAGESKVLTIKFRSIEQAGPVFVQRAHARLGVSLRRDGKFRTMNEDVRPDDWKPQQQPMRYQLEGPGWENDKVAFRHYWDNRNGKDIFGKTTNKLMLDSIGIPGTALGDYHKKAAWGMDILKVGTSLGAGGLAILKSNVLIPVGQTAAGRYSLVADGPVRAIIRLNQKGWDLGGVDAVDLREDITIWAGHYYYTNKVSLPGNTQVRELVTGITTVKNPDPKPIQVAVGNQTILATYAPQTENQQENLGMAVITPTEAFKGYGTAPKADAMVTQTEYVKLNINPGSHVTYAFFAGWQESDKAFATEAGFKTAVETAAKRLASPILFSK